MYAEGRFIDQTVHVMSAQPPHLPTSTRVPMKTITSALNEIAVPSTERIIQFVYFLMAII